MLTTKGKIKQFNMLKNMFCSNFFIIRVDFYLKPNVKDYFTIHMQWLTCNEEGMFFRRQKIKDTEHFFKWDDIISVKRVDKAIFIPIT